MTTARDVIAEALGPYLHDRDLDGGAADAVLAALKAKGFVVWSDEELREHDYNMAVED